METANDFLFLNEDMANKFNPFYEGEYLVIQTLPRNIELRVEYRSHDYYKAKSRCDIENFAHDYTSFGLRIFHQGQLWRVNCSGEATVLSKQQNWDVHPDYLAVHYNQNSDGEIVVHECSYPYFDSLKLTVNRYGESAEYWQPLTCLQSDNGREIDKCPNCGYSLIDDQDEEDEDTPVACIGCSNYHGELYGDAQLICAIHPYGCSDQICPDFEDNKNA
ncbi:MAG: hypothetical protein HC917_00430 [Richelia sp. SM2_1_7]|nr:hypothetical protein [Richelia sp. SM2_1_7]